MTRIGYKRIQQIAIALVYQHKIPRLARYENRAACAVCGDTEIGCRVWEHRNYSDPLNVRPVCTSCNAKLGPGSIDYYNVETLQMIRIKFKRVVGGGRFHRRYLMQATA